jgi:hypothetical protein
MEINQACGNLQRDPEPNLARVRVPVLIAHCAYQTGTAF